MNNYTGNINGYTAEVMQNQYNIYINIKHTITASKMHWNFVDDSNVIAMQYFYNFLIINLLQKSKKSSINTKNCDLCLDIWMRENRYFNIVHI